ncbi:LOW QUALITY PROTEIN: uncharacterized protein LOC108097251 [Drosophila ficusphila]|uniref:LOW QUALITY PROTEIN: uncharacterized protein LOC108097251 n=1 Tax=Drosophila ficusphila TaxID=30025 RepID=UPI001C89E571|nr:LOW QUALITY PROTEIN: uncharacterized protein LOC108097251 [Drosophila ficusphila]
MENLNSNFEKPEFDWDAINVGDYQLDHSQNFFAANKENLKRLSNANRSMSCPTPQKFCREQDDCESKDLVPLKELKKEHPNQFKEQAEDGSQEPKMESDEPKPKIRENSGEKHQIDTKQNIPLSWDEDEKYMTEADQHMVHDGPPPPAVRANLRLQWSPPRHQHPAAAGVMAEVGTIAAPKAYQFKDVYESKRQQALRKRSEEESKARQFHSRPMPNFRAMHKRMAELAVIHTITVPITPETLKHSQTRKALRCQDDQEPGHLADTRSKPFNLRCGQRVRDRREFDAAVQAGLEQKKKEHDEQRKRCEQEEIKEIRKMTLFKARPNPFK